MKKTELKEYLSGSVSELNKKYQELIDQLKKTNLDKSAGKSKDVNIESKLRKNIARIKTIIRQKELAKL
ncbi:50S ribosomal protein L29 [Candidatus Gottesmanbacteria bacterium RIFCSPHIGHO2_02_FULL_40_24]|uniref:Large ribosomal subunit protein uL29 n=1 Tax=Candidatus Gottesmanbacteria bacterium RIFCSPHIGHO2_01_FULL_40_15 TaxID=1798376 RepID=A0A1F5Z6P4_9BACT|nr:MAG: 50S ribosomal protein L29 [Candidatus Gottesmanbacteria bacterium RIFCSPHIGHO2_01_FULL_40_15]OGG18221.1 MAG: 50S ribosomal protein L29 [Candidatus Gottesmanbacteria bacterium RIFCSPHIGHO2_02_FULL_40_24]OGG22889.1 MAG: 50S ribosomal protein L29 [Candidatus Gottesmanbacteria bacterium RIFCSPLOWO2_01_FULL_40_10]OGG23505.1 MAG: 50S ribosomal protein L29 [Candidatus Gottesmanbacteria bacterium RIFCSPHIGHO2_12_FULL_40_13]OGG32495.1 MAG: 50S ribosomal protein L29 [Candidatus Gottesmanbacteria 